LVNTHQRRFQCIRGLDLPIMHT